MSIVDNTHQFRFFIIFLLLFLAPVTNADWRTDISHDFCQQWHAIDSQSKECELSFPGLSQQYQLPNCNQPIDFTSSRPLAPGRNGVVITCLQPQWTQNLAVQLHVYQDVVVLATHVGLDESLKAANLTLAKHDLGAIGKEYFTSVAAIIGQQLRRPVRIGTILTPSMLDSPLLINRGDLVTIQLKRSLVSIEVQGTALERGKLGQTIRVRNNQSDQIIAARVLDSGLVLVD